MSIWRLKVGSIVIRFADGIFDLVINYLISTDQALFLKYEFDLQTELLVRSTNQMFDLEILIWSADRMFDIEILIRSADQIFDLVIRSADQIFDLEKII